MKRTLFLGIVALIVSNLNAQITLEHTFSGNISVVNTHHKTVYFDAVINGNQFDFYNEDYSFYKTVTVIPPYGCKAYFISDVSDNLFNTDNDLEFYEKISPTFPMNESGTSNLSSIKNL